jgi:formylglycine-generating enzyme required for sulfatase activity
VEFVTIPAGALIMGDNRLRDASPQHQHAMQSFAIGKYPVTNGEYAAFIAARGYETEPYWTTMGWKWQRGRLLSSSADREPEPAFWRVLRLNQPRSPVVGVSWYEAVAFCNWLTEHLGAPFRLPTEREWEYAARGANDARNFPWGDKFERGRANTAEAGLGGTTPVSHFPSGVSPFGVWDMTGNVFEWTLSKWGTNWQELQYVYPYRPESGCEDVEGSGARVMRGGSWYNTYHEGLCAHRARYLAGSRGSNIGFRVVKVL